MLRIVLVTLTPSTGHQVALVFVYWPPEHHHLLPSWASHLTPPDIYLLHCIYTVINIIIIITDISMIIVQDTMMVATVRLSF